MEVVHGECSIQTSSVCQHSEMCGKWLGKSFFGEAEVWKMMHLLEEMRGLLECCGGFHSSAGGRR